MGTGYLPKRSMIPLLDNRKAIDSHLECGMASEKEKQTKDLLFEGAKAVGIVLNPHQTAQFLTYLEELKEWNKKINLTSIRDDQGIVVKHFVDSLAPLKYIEPRSTLLDVGSGAGFPAIPLKIAEPNLHVILVDSVRKKVSFQRHIIGQLKLDKIQTFHGRIGDKDPGFFKGRSFDVVISRAFAHLDKYLFLGEPYVKEGGCIIAMIGRFKEQEIKRHEKLLSTLNLIHSQTVHLSLPFLNEKRALLFFKKIHS